MKRAGFTIVELLVVIVVIGVLAAITVVSYTGLTNKAVLASLQSDLSNASTKLKAYQTLYGSYPTLDVNNCPSAPTVDSNYCLKFSPGNALATAPFSGYVPSNTTNPQTFSLTIENTTTDIISVITDSSKPAILTPAPLSPVADWIATPTGDHYGNYYDSVTKTWATVTRSTPKTIYDPATQHIYDVPANKLAVNPRSDGKSGHEAVIEEGRTNYVRNSYGATNDGSFWSTWNKFKNVVGTPTYSIAPSVYSTTGQRIQYSGQPADNGTFIYIAYQTTDNATFSAGDSVFGSLWAKGTISGATFTLWLDCWNSSGGYLGSVGGTAVTLNSSWQRATVSWPNLPAGADHIQVYPLISNIDNGDTADVTISAIQLEKGAFASSYIPTTTTAATRNADAVSVPTMGWNGTFGTFVEICGMPPGTWQSGAYWGGVFNPFAIAGGSYGNTTISHNGVNYATSNATASGYRVATATWNANTGVIGAYYNSISNFYNGSSFSVTPDASAYIGSYAGISWSLNAPIQRLIVYPSDLSPSDVTSVTNAIKDGP